MFTNKSFLNQLSTYLFEKYRPTALVLHGSRANGYAREHSDYDFVMFTKEDVKPAEREIVFGANIEVTQIILPVPEDKFLGFYLRTENTNVLHDPEGIMSAIIKCNEQWIAKGNTWTEDEKARRHAFLSSALDGIRDYHDVPLHLFDKKSEFYSRLVESWYRFKKSEFEPSYYIAYPTIAREDPELYALLEEFVHATGAEELCMIGRKVLERAW